MAERRRGRAVRLLCAGTRKLGNPRCYILINQHGQSGKTGETQIVQSGGVGFAIPNFSRRRMVAAVLVVAIAPAPIFGSDKSQSFKIPPVKIRLKIKDQQVTIVASGLVTMAARDHGLNIFSVELTADLADLQRNFTAVLASELDKDDRCGDRIQIEDAKLTPAEPASVAVVQLHYERWGCAKLLGKQEAKRLIGGNAVVQMKPTPSAGENHTELRLAAELGPIEADGSLGELLRTGNLGELLREKIQDAILSAVQKSVDLGTILPPVLQGSVTIQDARFRDAGSGRLIVALAGQVRITDEQLGALAKELKDRLPAH
jgi:hypothetical protein